MSIDFDPPAGRETGKTAIYVRLSVNENGERDESLETQCRLLQSYVERNIPGPYSFYRDNDISGTCFDRPGLIQMVKDINRGLVTSMVVKDLSRLGRNNGETLTFLDFLREKNIRLVSLGDNYDSFADDDEIIGIKTWVNEHYARDISRKVRSNLKKKMQSGQFLGRPPFGYLKSNQNRHRLAVDERYREIIIQIFSLYLQGWGYRALAGYVQSTGIPTPSRDKGYAAAPQTGRWNEQHIRRIITNRVYCGDTVQGVSEKISFKSKKTRRLNSERWIIVPRTHEAIISRETFATAQKIRKKRAAGQGRSSNKCGAVHLFSGFVFCGRCGSAHNFRKKKNRSPGYICGRYNRYGRKGCTSHNILEKQLLDFLVRDIRKMARGVPFKDVLAARYREEYGGPGEKARDIKRWEKEVARKKKQLQALYLDKLNGIIAAELFLEIKGRLEEEIRLFQRRIKQLQSQPDPEQITPVEKFISGLDLAQIVPQDIDRAFLESFLQKIIVFEKGDHVPKDIPGSPGLKFGVEHVPEELSGNLVFLYNLEYEDK